MITEAIGSYYLFIQGFRNARVDNLDTVLLDLRASFEGVDLQLLRADRVAGKEHLISAAKNGVNSFLSKDRRSKHLSMEFLLFASGQHQIVEAISLLGVAVSSKEIALVGLSETRFDHNALGGRVASSLEGRADDTVLDIESPSKARELKRAYNISDKELSSSRMPGETDNSVVKRLVIERSALLALEN